MIRNVNSKSLQQGQQLVLQLLPLRLRLGDPDRKASEAGASAMAQDRELRPQSRWKEKKRSVFRAFQGPANRKSRLRTSQRLS